MVKFQKKLKYDKIWIGIVSGFVTASLVTLVVIYANAKDYSIMYHFNHLFDNEEWSPIFRSRILLSLKGGAIGIMPLFYLFLNKKMYRSVKGLIVVAALIFLIIVAGALM